MYFPASSQARVSAHCNRVLRPWLVRMTSSYWPFLSVRRFTAYSRWLVTGLSRLATPITPKGDEGRLASHLHLEVVRTQPAAFVCILQHQPANQAKVLYCTFSYLFSFFPLWGRVGTCAPSVTWKSAKQTDTVCCVPDKKGTTKEVLRQVCYICTSVRSCLSRAMRG